MLVLLLSQHLLPSRAVRPSLSTTTKFTLTCTLFGVCARPPQDQVYNCAKSYNEHCIKLFSPVSELELGSNDAQRGLMVSTASTPVYNHSASKTVQARPPRNAEFHHIQ